MNPQNDQTWNTALDSGIDLQNQKITLTPEYDQALTEAQNQFKALSKTVSLFVGEHAAPDMIGFQCVIDDCKTAWKNGQGIRENSVENCPS